MWLDCRPLYPSFAVAALGHGHEMIAAAQALAEIVANDAQLGKPFGRSFTQAISIALVPEMHPH